MKVTGIIAEYNPFHSGHAYQLKFAKTFSDAVIVVMSGSFVQRGDVAIFDKWSRSDTALKNGADLVLELPVVFSMNTAERFAFGGISILDKIKITDYVLFGSECGNIDKLLTAASLLENEDTEISEKIRNFMSFGDSYPVARQKAYESVIDSSLLSSPNNILGLEYIRQLYRKNSKIKPVTLKREGADYHENTLKAEFPSATALRNAIINEGYEYELFYGSDIHRIENLYSAILYNIRKNGQNAFSDIFDVSEGIENRIILASQTAKSFNDLINKVNTKRYTDAKIRRIILSSLLGLNSSLSKSDPCYIRVLGATKTGFELLKKIKSKSNVNIITKTADFKEKNLMFEKDILSTDIYDLSADSPGGFGRDFKQSPIIYGGKE